jgi:hypothetical protein
VTLYSIGAAISAHFARFQSALLEIKNHSSRTFGEAPIPRSDVSTFHSSPFHSLVVLFIWLKGFFEEPPTPPLAPPTHKPAV